jgi:hypothetical protein
MTEESRLPADLPDHWLDPQALDRRQLLFTLGATSAAAAAFGLLGASSAQAQIQAPNVGEAVKFVSKIDFADPKWNRDAYARMQSNLDYNKVKIGWYKGVVLGVRDGERVRELFGFEGFSTNRMLQLPDGSWRKLLRETVFYRDMKTGKILDTYKNPYTDEEVKVVNVFNDPFNLTISEYYPDPPNYGGLNAEKPPKRPFLLPWSEKGDKLLLTTDIHLYYRNALQPDKWPRESAGENVRVSEMFRYVIDRDDMANPKNNFVHYHGTWNRITPWLPWMLMGQAPGHCLYVGNMGGSDDWSYVPQDLVDWCKANGQAKYLEAPWEDYGPSLSSIENYAREQTPAPVKR